MPLMERSNSVLTPRIYDIYTHDTIPTFVDVESGGTCQTMQESILLADQNSNRVWHTQAMQHKQTSIHELDPNANEDRWHDDASELLQARASHIIGCPSVAWVV